MKRVNNLYDIITNINVIRNMYFDEVSRTTKNKRKIENFSNYLSLNLVNIRNMLVEENVVFDKYIVFLIQEPKYRLIMSQSIKDKIINHLVAHYFILNVFEPSLVDSNVATRKGFGTSMGIKLLKRYINELKKSGKKIYYLKCDIEKYFYNIDHSTLKKIINKKIKDPKALNLIYKIIDSTNNNELNNKIEEICNKEIEKVKNLNISNKEKNLKIKSLEKIMSLKFSKKGIPIGNMTSQGFSIIYLNEFDHFVKEELHQKYYIRYMDDFICLSNDRGELERLKEIFSKKLYDDYKLNLNKKTQIGCIDNGLYFLGFVFKLYNNKLYLRLNSRVKRNFKRRMKKIKRKLNSDRYDKEHVLSVIGSYKGHLKEGNTYYLYSNIIRGIDLSKLKK